jgi:hypothetical protein
VRFRTVWEHTKGHGFIYIWTEQLKKTNFGFELGLLTKASYQGQAHCRTVWELTKGHGFLYMWMEQLKKTNFGFECGPLAKDSYQAKPWVTNRRRCAGSRTTLNSEQHVEQFGRAPKTAWSSKHLDRTSKSPNMVKPF